MDLLMVPGLVIFCILACYKYYNWLVNPSKSAAHPIYINYGLEKWNIHYASLLAIPTHHTAVQIKIVWKAHCNQSNYYEKYGRFCM